MHIAFDKEARDQIKKGIISSIRTRQVMGENGKRVERAGDAMAYQKLPTRWLGRVHRITIF